MGHFLFGLKGRLPRASFCLFAVIAFVAFLALMSALYAYAIMAGDYERGGPTPLPTSPAAVAGAALWAVALILLCVSSLAVSLRRLHDRNKAWWWLLVFFALPNALDAAGDQIAQSGLAGADYAGLGCRTACWLISAWAFVELTSLRGTPGPNRFGPDPLAHKT